MPMVLRPKKTATEMLDMYYLEARSHLLETAAIFDRVGLHDDAVAADPRLQLLQQACEIIVRKDCQDRAEQFLRLFSLVD